MFAPRKRLRVISYIVLKMSVFFSSGPFRQCDDYVYPNDQYDSCLYDACLLGIDSEAICSAYEQYAQICQRYGQAVYDWRSTLTQCGKYTYFTCVARYSPLLLCDRKKNGCFINSQLVNIIHALLCIKHTRESRPDLCYKCQCPLKFNCIVIVIHYFSKIRICIHG